MTGTLRRFEEALEWFNGFVIAIETAQARLIAAASVLALREKGIEPEESAATSPLALDAYNEWLHMERRLLCVEMYGTKDAWERGKFVKHTAANDFHFPGYRLWKDGPQPSSRAERVLDMMGVDWRKDGWREADTARHMTKLIDRAVAGKFYGDKDHDISTGEAAA